MNILQLSNILVHFLSFLIYTGLIIYVVRKNPKARLNRLCALTITSFAIWSLGLVFSHGTTSSGTAMLWMNIASIGWCSFPVFTLWFYLAFTGHERLLRNRVFIVFCALLALGFIYLQWTGYLIDDLIRQPYGWATVWALSIPAYVFFAYYFLFTVACIPLALDFGRKTRNLREKKQTRVLFITPIVVLILGSLSDIVFPSMGIDIVPPIAIVFILIWAGGLVYAITRYGLMTFTPAAVADDILATMGDSLIMTDMKGKIIAANKAAIDLLGYKADELVNKQFNSIIGEKTNDGDAPWQEVLEKGKVSSRDTTYLTRNGEGVPVLVSASVVKDKDGEPAGVVITAHDMSERRKIEQALRESEQKYRSLVEHALVGICIHQDFKIVYANRELADMLGYTLAESTGLSIAELIHPDERNMIMARAQRRQAGSAEPEAYEIRLLKKDGSVLYALISNAVIEYGGRPATLLTLADITGTRARRELEQSNRELKKLVGRLEQISEERKQVFLSVSHDLRTPLTSIVGFSDLLSNDANIPSSAKEYLQIINDEALRLNRLINDILDISRDEVGKLEWHMGIQDMSEILRSSISSVSVLAEEKELKIEVNISDNLPGVYGDKDRLQQVVVNLLSNAIKSTFEGQVSVGIEQREQDMLVRVADTGIGIREEDRDKLFKPFGRTTDRYDGAGLGLSICKMIVDHHGGKIWFESEFGKGTTFYFTVPLAEINHSSD